jgi:hypothetical protein
VILALGCGTLAIIFNVIAYANGLARTVSSEIGPLSQVLPLQVSSSRGDDEPPAKRPRFFNPFEKNSRLPSSIPTYAAAIIGLSVGSSTHCDPSALFVLGVSTVRICNIELHTVCVIINRTGSISSAVC